MYKNSESESERPLFFNMMAYIVCTCKLYTCNLEGDLWSIIMQPMFDTYNDLLI